MARYIDAEKIPWTDLSDGKGLCYATFSDVVCRIPTADVVEVIRCNDCQNCETRKTANYLPFLFCKLNDHSVAETGFCCWAERRING